MESGKEDNRSLDLERRKQSSKTKPPNIWQPLTLLLSSMEMWVFIFVPNIYFFIQQPESQGLDSGTNFVFLKLHTRRRLTTSAFVSV